MKPNVLVVELWGLGDLVIATPFLQAVSRQFAVTLLAKPYALELQPRLWPEVTVVPFVAPWTAFKGKYWLWHWPWARMFRLQRQLAAQRFEFGLSARWDPRDHLLLRLVGAKARLGFPRLRSQLWLTEPVARPDPRFHRYEHWRAMGQALGLALPPREQLAIPVLHPEGRILIHTGAGQPIRVWPLERYRRLADRLRQKGFAVELACDPDQRPWWLAAGETNVVTPHSVSELLALIDRAAAFVGNDSGPGHLAAFCGVPTFTLFGPQLWEWFGPLHPLSLSLEGKPCPYKPCSDYCRFPTPLCMDLDEAEVGARLETFLARVLGVRAGIGSAVPTPGAGRL